VTSHSPHKKLFLTAVHTLSCTVTLTSSIITHQFGQYIISAVLKIIDCWELNKNRPTLNLWRRLQCCVKQPSATDTTYKVLVTTFPISTHAITRLGRAWIAFPRHTRLSIAPTQTSHLDTLHSPFQPSPDTCWIVCATESRLHVLHLWSRMYSFPTYQILPSHTLSSDGLNSNYITAQSFPDRSRQVMSW